jgi:hypothetical protein
MSTRQNWKRTQTDTEEKLYKALCEEKSMTARWYQRISGLVPWNPGERERLDALMDSQTATVNRMIRENAED